MVKEIWNNFVCRVVLLVVTIPALYLLIVDLRLGLLQEGVAK